ncbi:MAG: hypothetical protein ACPGR2_12850 [Psychrobium sp.]
MSKDKALEYQENLPYLDDPDLFHAAKVAIHIIVEKHGKKSDSIKNVARKYKVRESELKECIEAAIPRLYFAERSAKAKQRHEASFYQAPEIRAIPETKKKSGQDKLKEIRELLNRDQ